MCPCRWEESRHCVGTNQCALEADLELVLEVIGVGAEGETDIIWSRARQKGEVNVCSLAQSLHA